ncbi:hypothetical protein Q4525_14895 [Shimia thalassica]|uniref:hypothetical protein n=1 Tax=Shimia thalassica TaxID=1715693 RepID=UPI001C0807A0|nr:hypothetical protein [Shimia thalassica]MBU2943148.1 hypothetical protein [Shimia thalassica]MDO6504225.1 hypothetical protein [Shimia thalassica]
MTTNSKSIIAPLEPDALAVVTSPELVADTPSLRTFAWATLMTQRGHVVNQTRLSAMQDRQFAAGSAV